MSKVQCKYNFKNVFLHFTCVDVSFLNYQFKTDKIYFLTNVTTFLNFSIITPLYAEIGLDSFSGYQWLWSANRIGHDINRTNTELI